MRSPLILLTAKTYKPSLLKLYSDPLGISPVNHQHFLFVNQRQQFLFSNPNYLPVSRFLCLSASLKVFISVVPFRQLSAASPKP